PDAEQADWGKAWAEVQALDKQARACFSAKQLAGSLTRRHKEPVHEVSLQAGKTYSFDLETTAFDPLLRLQDGKGQKVKGGVAIDQGLTRIARIVFAADAGGNYRLSATSPGAHGTGAYVLRIREFTAPDK